MDHLVMAAETRLGEAFHKQANDPYALWYEHGTDPNTNEYIAWYRLGESRELDDPSVEIFDVGLVMDGARVDRSLESISFDSLNGSHFYIRKPRLSRRPLVISERNSLQVIRPRRQRIRHGADITPISDLEHKLNDYPLRQMRVQTEKRPSS